MKNIENSQIILFDGVCNLCHSFIQFIIKHDRKGKFHFASLQSESAKKWLRKAGWEEPSNRAIYNTVIYIENNKAYYKSNAVLKIGKNLGFPFYLIQFLYIIPTPLLDFFYDIISKNRYKWFGTNDNCELTQTVKKIDL